MDTEILKLVPASLQAVAIIVGGLWAYWKFVIQRQKEPATDIDIDLRFVGIQQEQWIIEVTCSLENKSLVRHTYKNFRVKIRYLKSGDQIKDNMKNPEVLYQLDVPHTIDDRENIEGKKLKRSFANLANLEQNFINPKQNFRHRYITFIPIEATFVLVLCTFASDKVSKMSSQKIFRVPATGETGLLSTETSAV